MLRKLSTRVLSQHRSLTSLSKLNQFSRTNQLNILKNTVSCTSKVPFVSSCYSTQAAAEVPEEKYEFQTETAELLNIVAKSLYSENEVFIRELVSNASDALEKLRYAGLTEESSGLVGEGHKFEVKVTTNKQDNTITIQDNGIGMTKEELIKNLGTIARSGSKEFLKEVAQKGDPNSSIIGQFGVGFYSSFMVANRVEVHTKSYLPDSIGYCWTSEGGVSYDISESSEAEQGTKILIHLKSDCRKFSEDDTVKDILSKHSSFVGFPVTLNSTVLNAVPPLWTLEAKDIDEDQHLNFFRHLSGNDQEHYMYKLFYKTDAPLNIRSVFYVSEQRPSLLEMAKDQTGNSGVSLYSRKVLIQHKAAHVVPKWMRFLRGVIDSEDIPLNISRELLQNNQLIAKLRETVTSRVVRFFLQQAKRDPEKYMKFHDSYKMFITEGVLSDETSSQREEVAQLLRYESSHTENGVSTGLKDYISRMQEGQRHIYYLCAPNRELAESSPYFEALKAKNVEILFCFDAYDEVLMMQLQKFDDKQLFSVENEVVADMFKPTDSSGEAPKEESEASSDVTMKLSNTQADELVSWAKTSLGMKVDQVKVTDKLDKHPAMVTVWEMGSIRHFLRSQYLTDSKQMSEEEKIALFKPTLQLSSNHPIVMKLHKLKDEEDELASLVLRQLYDNAMISAGLTEDARPMVTRINELLDKVLASK